MATVKSVLKSCIQNLSVSHCSCYQESMCGITIMVAIIAISVSVAMPG